MNLRFPLTMSILGAVLLLGAGCAETSQPDTTNPDATNPDTATPDTSSDPYAGWKNVEVGNVVAFRIPADCTQEAAAGSMYISCSGGDEELKMVISSDGENVHVRAGDDKTWDEWDKVIKSANLLAPLNRTVTLTITDPGDE